LQKLRLLQGQTLKIGKRLITKHLYKCCKILADGTFTNAVAALQEALVQIM
jgi:hypothetical protein